jgi:hypothetical protein
MPTSSSARRAVRSTEFSPSTSRFPPDLSNRVDRTVLAHHQHGRPSSTTGTTDLHAQ